MSTEWVVTTAAERFALNAQRQGEMTFTVTNPTGATDRAVFDVVPGEGAEADWFQVDEPQRVVRGTASVSYLVKASVPAQAKPGEFAVQGRVYSADSAPEESSVLSSRVMLTVAGAAVPTRRWIPWWIWLIVALVVIAIITTVTVVVVNSGSPTPAPTPSATATAPPTGPIPVPDLSKADPTTILATLTQAGLTGTVKYRQDPGHTGQIEQTIPAGTRVAHDTKVDVVVHVSLAAPLQLTPVLGARVPLGEATTLTWKQPESYVHNWRVLIYMHTCFFQAGVANACADLLTVNTIVHQPSYKSDLYFSTPNPNGVYFSGIFYWRIVAQDDFVNDGGSSPSWGAAAI